MPESVPLRKDPATVTATPAPALDAERTELLAEIALARTTLVATLRDLSDAQLGERPTASALCLGGLVKHVATTEEAWGRFLLEGPAGMPFDLPEGVTWDDFIS